MLTVLGTFRNRRNATTALATEQERHRHAKEELNKAKSALQFVKTQAAVRSSLRRRERSPEAREHC